MTQGILEKEVYFCLESSPGMVAEIGSFGKSYFENEWWKDKDLAIKKAYEMKWAKIESLQKQISKLRLLVF